MNKAVMISIKPKWCELIANGKKTVEVRKREPKLEPPFKVYIYCTNTRPFLVWGDVFRGNWETEFTRLSGYSRKDAEEIWDVFNGKVIGEFVCDKICALPLAFDDNGSWWHQWNETWVTEKTTCLSFEEIDEYVGRKFGYAWHISDLKIYDTPMEINRFVSASTINTNCFGQHLKRLERPPQSWCYVEEV